MRRRTDDADLAEDVSSQVFMEARRRRSKQELLNGSLRSWLLGVVANLVKLHRRSIVRRGCAIQRLHLPVPVLDNADDVIERLDDKQRLVGLRSELEKMPLKQAEALLVSVGRTQLWEIAKVLDIPIGTVR